MDTPSTPPDFHTLIEQAPLAIYRFTLAVPSTVVYLSPHIEHITGFTPQAFMDNPKLWDEIIYPDDRSIVASRNNSLRKKQQPKSIEYRLINSSGDLIWVKDEGVWLKGASKDSDCCQGFLIDISEQKKMESTLLEAKSRMEQAVHFKEEFFSHLSHELRTPINAINGVSKLMEDTKLSNEQQQYLNIIRFSTNNLLALVNDVLDFSKAEAGKIIFENISFDLHKQIKDIVEMMRPKATRNSNHLTFEISEKVPHFLLGDPYRLTQILMNLLSNAIKFTHDGVVALIVKAKEDSEQQINLQFEVRDTGIGIPDHMKVSIFERFIQVQTTQKRAEEGTGLGLAITKKLVELQGGSIGVSSIVGEGSTFFFNLTFQKDLMPVESSATDSNHKASEKFRVLLVEDNDMNRMVTTQILRKQYPEMTIDIAEHGLDGIALLKEHPYQIVLMDLQMPVMDGFEATTYIREQLKNDNKSVPIIAVTAAVNINDRDRVLASGIDDLIIKPFEPEDLFKAMHKALAASSSNA